MATQHSLYFSAMSSPSPRTTPVHPFTGPILPGGTIALLYPQDDPSPRFVSWPVDTLARAAQMEPLPHFDYNPAACTFCSRPYEVLSVGPITLLFTCLHFDDDADPVSRNASIMDVLARHDSIHDPPLGNVIALKHARPASQDPETGRPSVEDLRAIPLVEPKPADLQAIDEMVVAACFALRHLKKDWTYFVPALIAETTFNEDGSRLYPPIPSGEALRDVKVNHKKRAKPVDPVDPDGAIVIYTDDEDNEEVFRLLSRLELSDSSPPEPTAGHTPTIPHQTRPHKATAARPSPPPTRPPSAVPSSTPSSTPAPSRLYRYQSSSVPPSLTSHWHQAAAATQGTPLGLARTVIRAKKKRPKSAAYAVIRGSQIGVWDHWSGLEGAEQHTKGVRFALYSGFPNRQAAQAVFDFSSRAGWTSTENVATLTPVPLALVPHPVRHEHDLDGHTPRSPGDWWYVVFVGVHPGLYPSRHVSAASISFVNAHIIQ
ncbi:hypothetical protein C8F01DRAFT_1254017 [Mycena amicta]|nr:hypothetical protein C8F01DRAFT_1254017 [Mycena amicta]